MSGTNESAAILSTVEKAELMSAIGREIERVDRQSASNGYTSWALWAAIGVLGWKAIGLLGAEANAEIGLIYLLLAITLAVARVPFTFLFRPQTNSYFRSIESLGKAGVMRLLLVAFFSGTCVLIQFLRAPLTAVEFWMPTAFVALPVLVSAFAFVMPRMPIGDAMPKKGPGRSAFWLVPMLFLAMGIASILVLLPAVDWRHVVRPTANVKVAILLVVVTVLTFRLSKNMQVGERRTQFQRLETELALAKIDVSEAKERYENLMLGMNVTLAIRPWVDAVMLPLDEANAGLSEVKQLLLRFQQTRASAGPGDNDNSPLDAAVAQRVRSLLGNAMNQFKASGKAYAKLKSISYMMFGEKDISKSPISSEIDRIHQARGRFEQAFEEIDALAEVGVSD